MSTAPRPPYCEACSCGVPATHITGDQRHDPAAGGCGGPVVPLPDLPGGAVAIGVFAKMGERWVMQWPPTSSVRLAKASAGRFTPGAEIELRPLFDGPAADIPYMERIEVLMRLNEQLAQALADRADGNRELLEEVAKLREDAERLDTLEKLANQPAGLLLHPGIRVPTYSPGLGLASIGRTLRQATDSLRNKGAAS